MFSLNNKIKKTKGLWISDLGDGFYKNPVLYADYSDPDVIRVGKDFYMVASSFTYIPGIPLLHSKDLVNWKVVNYIFDSIPLAVYQKPQHGNGSWAPSIRYHDKKYWVFFSTPDEGIFMSSAEDPLSKWSPLVCIKEVKGWIDPCPFWDEDGKAYLVHAFANSRCGIKSKLHINKMSPDGTELLDEGTLVFDGTVSHPTIEGPKMYKRNGYYYIFAPAGGVKHGFQTILRSKNIYGPYEDKIVLHQGNTEINGPHQGGFVELESCESWFIHFQDCNEYGRVVHLQPVKWVEDWPLMGEDINGDGIGEPVSKYKKPNVGESYPIEVPETSDEFDGEKLGLQWQWQANPKSEWYSLTENPGHLRLFSGNDETIHSNTLYNSSNLLSQLIQTTEFNATVKLTLMPNNKVDRAGLVIMGHHYSYISLNKTDNGYVVSQTIGLAKEGEVSEYIVENKYVEVNTIFFRVKVQNAMKCMFSYSFDGEKFEQLGSSFKGSEGHWVGAKIGIFNLNFTEEISNGYADFHWIRFCK